MLNKDNSRSIIVSSSIINQNESNLGLFNVLSFVSSLLHQGLVIQQLQSVHLFTVLLVLLILHLGHQHILVLLVHVLQVFLFVLLVLEES